MKRARASLSASSAKALTSSWPYLEFPNLDFLKMTSVTRNDSFQKEDNTANGRADFSSETISEHRIASLFFSWQDQASPPSAV